MASSGRKKIQKEDKSLHLADLRDIFDKKFQPPKQQFQVPFQFAEESVRNKEAFGFVKRTFQAPEIQMKASVSGNAGWYAQKKEISIRESQQRHLKELRESSVRVGNDKTQVLNNINIYLKVQKASDDPGGRGRTCIRAFSKKYLGPNSFVCHVGGYLKALLLRDVFEHARRPENPECFKAIVPYDDLSYYCIRARSAKSKVCRTIDGPFDLKKPLVLETFEWDGSRLTSCFPSSFVKYAKRKGKGNVCLRFVVDPDANRGDSRKHYWYLCTLPGKEIQPHDEILLEPFWCKVVEGKEEECSSKTEGEKEKQEQLCGEDEESGGQDNVEEKMMESVQAEHELSGTPDVAGSDVSTEQ